MSDDRANEDDVGEADASRASENDRSRDETDENEAGTTDESYRWKYLSTLVTVVVTVGYTLLLLAQAYGVLGNVPGGTWATYSLAFLAVVAYSVGVDTLREAKKARSTS
jgi:hypothetical protein